MSLQQQLNTLLAKAGLLPGQKQRMPPFRYFTQGPTRFCWNTEPLTPMIETKNKSWAAWQYRVNKEKGSWHLVKGPVYFARRKAARNKAQKWYTKARLEKERRTAKIVYLGGPNTQTEKLAEAFQGLHTTDKCPLFKGGGCPNCRPKVFPA